MAAPRFRRVVLLYNPVAGQRLQLREQVIRAIVDKLHAAGVDVEAWPTYAPGSAIPLVQEALVKGFDAVLVCGGDGTVHEAAQGMVGRSIPLGVIPMGTANLIAVNLGLSNSTFKAVDRLLTARVERIPLGRIEFLSPAGQKCSRYFLAVAGIGPDSLFLSRPEGGLKRRFGYISYVLEAIRVWWTYSYPFYEAHIYEPEAVQPRRERFTQLLAVRIRHFGPVLQNLAPGASLTRPLLRLVGFRTRYRWDFLGFFASTILLCRPRFSRRVELFDAVAVECRPLAGVLSPVPVEADGEVLGTLPARLEMTDQTIAVLVPSAAPRLSAFEG